MFNLKRKLTYNVRVGGLFGLILLSLLILVIIADQQLCFGLLNVIPTCHWYDVRCWLPVVLLLVRDMIPGLVTLGVLGFLSADFVKAVYGLKTRSQGFEFVKRLLFGMSGFRPFLRIAGGKLEGNDKDLLVRSGGPCGLIVYNDSAAILEKAGRLTRVVKPGFPRLEPFEKIWDVVDLRPHRWVYDVSAMSKDGIPVTCQADVTLQIDDGGQAPSQDAPYPATEQAILMAATRKLIREASRSEDDQKMDWAGRAIVGATEGALRTILATYLLDQFLGPDEVNRNNYRSQIRSALEVELRKSFPDVGAKLIKVELGNITVDDKVTQQQIEAWQNLWKRWTKEREAEGEAERLQAIEAAKAQAQADMIVSITQAFQALTDAGAVIPSQLVLLRMFEVLKRAPYDPQTGMLFLPAEVMRTWQMIQEVAQGRPPTPGQLP
jgi:regulator of protease activity HflC (stomatin/prohibitin superfamily)